MAVIQLSDGNDDGTTLGQSVTDKVSLYGVTPVVQPAAAAQVVLASDANAATIVVLVNALRTALIATGNIKGAA